ncbi:aldo/keto reductase [Marinivivus vitaminiproducens]|uniref:aldo/keto reductase n=1 Tax=Marinivivus vitaminiproducens TaxID=3035935 RepID=UPI00279A35A3|nr:aldo/keto reductase [Geminicoccaceae bacterium SCSIO 64248]
METRKLGRTGLLVSPIAIGGAAFTYVNQAKDWDPWSDEGRRTVVSTIHAALDHGITYIDTAPAYGDGHSETLIGEVMKTRRGDCVLASKVWYEHDRQGVIDSVHSSLRRLNTDHIDILQVHGRMYQPAEVDHILNGGPLDALRELREAGKIGHIGITTEEPWTVMPFLSCDDVDVYQIAYNLIYQGASRHFLIEAAKADVGVVTMRTMTSGIFQREAQFLAPGWQRTHDLYEASLKFVLSDSRIHAGIVSMRWPEEVARNVQTIEGWQAPFDFASMPRLTFEVYKAEDGD